MGVLANFHQRYPQPEIRFWLNIQRLRLFQNFEQLLRRFKQRAVDCEMANLESTEINMCETSAEIAKSQALLDAGPQDNVRISAHLNILIWSHHCWTNSEQTQRPSLEYWIRSGMHLQ